MTERQSFARDKNPWEIPVGSVVFLVGIGSVFFAQLVARESAAAMIVLAAVGLALIVGGTWIALGGEALLVDRAEGQVCRTRSFLFYRSEECCPFSDFKQVQISKELWSSGYLVRVTGPKRTLLLASSKSYESAHTRARRLAEFAGWSLVDRVSGSRLEAKELEESLVARLRRAGPAPADPGAPPGRGLAVDRADGRLRVAFRTFQGPPRALAALAFILLVGVIFGAGSVSPHCLWGLVPFAALFGVCVAWSLRRESLDLSVEGVRHQVRKPGRLRAIEIPAGRVVEVEIGPTSDGQQAVFVRSDEAVAAVGWGLKPEELEWLRAAMVSALCGEK